MCCGSLMNATYNFKLKQGIMRYLCGFFLFVALLSSNTTFAQAQKLPSAKKMAKTMCNCMEPLMEMVSKIEQMEKDGASIEDPAFMQTMQEMETVAAEFDECMGGMQAFEEGMAALSEEKAKKYEADLKKAVKKSCPDVYNILEGGDETE